MKRFWKFPSLSVLLAAAFLSGGTAPAEAAPKASKLPAQTKPLAIRSHATLHSFGIEWDIQGDANHNARCAVQFRRAGSDVWLDAMDLLRVDYKGWWKSGSVQADRHYNMLAGSLMFLTPGTDYEVRLALTDPDGGSVTRGLKFRTRPVPQIPAGGRQLHVQPGEGGGSGTAADPFQGIGAADAQAQPGDIFLLHGGNYGQVTLQASGGEDGRYVVWKSAGKGDAVIEGLTVRADRLWLEGLTLINNQKLRNGLLDEGGHKDVVVTRNIFRGYNYSIRLNNDSFGWQIADNDIIGDKTNEQPMPPGEQPMQLSGEGVELNHSSGHTVAYNRITRAADGISYPGRDCDIYGNDIFNVTDDGLEPDYSYANNRMWGNRITDASNFALSFQPMLCGPWYYVRNQVSGIGRLYKFNGPTDRFVVINNTFVARSPVVIRASALLGAFARNNLYISADDGPMWNGKPWGGVGKGMHENNFEPNWKTDLDYDGFDWGGKRGAFTWDDRTYNDLASFSKDLGIEKHGLRVDKREIFENYRNPADWLPLRAGSNAVDAGAVVPGINNDFAGRAPDLGAYELGRPLPHYGPRDEAAMPAHGNYWAKW